MGLLDLPRPDTPDSPAVRAEPFPLPAGRPGPALVWRQGTRSRSLTWDALAHGMAGFAAEVRARLCPQPLLLIEASNRPGPVIAYLAALREGWPVILTAPGGAGAESGIRHRFAPNGLVTAAEGATGWRLGTGADEPAAMHPDLAVMLSTSGTTGAPRLVRLSRENIRSNAAAIAGYLGLTPADRAITALPFHYSYGMSVLHAQMLAGAPLILTETPVTDPAFWALAREAGATSLALVASQIEALDRAGRDPAAELPSLRYMTQAGGRIETALARRMAARAEAGGWELFLMYGQTEAGPRMAYLPPRQARIYADRIGGPVADSRLWLADEAGREIAGCGEPGELVFEGPGVMLGYAEDRTGLAAPAGPRQLRTGDIAERCATGHFRLLGRKSRFLKLQGLRIGLDEVEARFAASGRRVVATGSDSAGLVLFLPGATGPAARATAAALAFDTAREFRLAPGSVRAAPIGEVPCLSSGKTDYAALAARAEALPPALAPDPDLASVLALALRDGAPDMGASFRAQGGDSLAYLSVQLHFSERGVTLPEGWEDLPLARLAALTRAGTEAEGGRTAGPGTLRAAVRRWPRLPADLAGRVLALFAVIALHATSWRTGGGAFLLLGLAGYSLARFQIGPLSRGEAGRMLATMLVPMLALYYALIAATGLVWRPLPLSLFTLTANFGPQPQALAPYWFVSTYVQLTLLFALPFLIPALRRRLAAAPFAFGLAALAAAALANSASGLGALPLALRHHPPLMALELALLGWCAWFAGTRARRLAVSAALAAVWALHWRDAPATVSLLCFGGLAAALWRLSLPVPAPLLRLAMRTGSLALFAYLLHPAAVSLVVRLLPPVPDLPRFLAVAALTLAGAALVRRASGALLALWLATPEGARPGGPVPLRRAGRSRPG